MAARAATGSPVRSASTTAGNGRNGTVATRERIVGSIRPAWSETSTKTPYAGGSSSDFRRAFAPSSRSRCASRMR